MLQSHKGRKTVPHVVSVTGNMDRGLMAFLSNSLQLLRREDGRRRLQQRNVKKKCSHFFNLIVILFCDATQLLTLISGAEVTSSVGASQSSSRHREGAHYGAETGKKNIKIWIVVFLIPGNDLHVIGSVQNCLLIHGHWGDNLFCRSVRAFFKSFWRLRSLRGLGIWRQCRHQWSSWTPSKVLLNAQMDAELLTRGELVVFLLLWTHVCMLVSCLIAF